MKTQHEHTRIAHMNRKSQFFPLGDDNPVARFPFVNWALIAINIVVFVMSLGDFEQVINMFGFTPANFEPITLLTSMFLHGSVAHIIGNMWFLLIFGDNVEDRLGHLQYALFYLLGGLAASIAHFLLNIGSTVPAIGASGAISAVLGAYLVFYPDAGVYISGQIGRMGKISAKLMLLAWFGYQLLSSVSTLFGAESGIAFFAHIGGFIFGAAGALVYKAISKR